MGAGRQAAPPHPFQTALTPPGLETPVMELRCSPISSLLSRLCFAVARVSSVIEFKQMLRVVDRLRDDASPIDPAVGAVGHAPARGVVWPARGPQKHCLAEGPPQLHGAQAPIRSVWGGGGA